MASSSEHWIKITVKNNATLQDWSFDPIKGTVIEETLLIQVDFQNKNPSMKGTRVNKKEGAFGVPLISIQYNSQKLNLEKITTHRTIYDFSISCKTSAPVGSDGMAPFFVAVIAPHALANLIASTSFF
jgi:hypothetical protein